MFLCARLGLSSLTVSVFAYWFELDSCVNIKGEKVVYLTRFMSRKFKGEICCGGHLTVTYGGELLYLRIFS